MGNMMNGIRLLRHDLRWPRPPATTSSSPRFARNRSDPVAGHHQQPSSRTGHLVPRSKPTRWMRYCDTSRPEQTSGAPACTACATRSPWPPSWPRRGRVGLTPTGAGL